MLSWKPTAERSALCALTVDVEDWYQSYMRGRAAVSWRVVRNTERVLRFLDEHNTLATFFVVAEVARAFPALVRSIAEAGHEVQCHGDRHVPLYDLTPVAARSSFERARKTLEDVIGREVHAFRAPYFSIGLQNLWALDCLAAAGFRVDSSIFPIKMRRYGIAGWPLAPHHLQLENGDSLLEVPVACAQHESLRWPVAGGGYLRLLPQHLVVQSIDAVLSQERPAVLYCHPYEFGFDEVSEYTHLVPWRDRLRQQVGRRHLVRSLSALLQCKRFVRLDVVTQQLCPRRIATTLDLEAS